MKLVCPIFLTFLFYYEEKESKKEASNNKQGVQQNVHKGRSTKHKELAQSKRPKSDDSDEDDQLITSYETISIQVIAYAAQFGFTYINLV